MLNMLGSINWEVIGAIGVITTLILMMRYVFPNVKPDIYKDIKNGLLLFGYAFRDDKLKAISDMLFNIVVEVEKLHASNLSKQYEAITEAQTRLLEEFDIQIEYEALELIIDIAVAYLPPTKEEDKTIE